MTLSKNSISVVFDDHKMYAESFSSLIERMGFFQSSVFFTEEKDLIQFFASTSSKVQLYLFIDYYLKDKHTIPVINDARRLVKNIKIIVVSSVMDSASIINIFSCKPDGFLSKSSSFSEAVECIKILENDNQYVSPLIENFLNDTSEIINNPFSNREIEMLQYFNQGYSISDTAEKVFLSKHTIVAHRRRMMEKAGCKSIGELLAFARKRGVI